MWARLQATAYPGSGLLRVGSKILVKVVVTDNDKHTILLRNFTIYCSKKFIVYMTPRKRKLKEPFFKRIKMRMTRTQESSFINFSCGNKLGLM
jgi:hypothetical protein